MFENARLKLERADKHIRDLNDVLNAFVGSDFYDLFIQKDRKFEDRVEAFFAQNIPFPIMAPLIIGDAVHNMRTALDIAMCDTIVAFGGTPRENTTFKFFETREKLEKKLAGNEGVMKAIPDLLAKVAECADFYIREDNPYWGLHNLDVADKHTMILPVASVCNINEIRIFDGLTGRNIWPTPFNTKMFLRTSPIPYYAAFAGLNTLPNEQIEIDHDYKPAISVLFGEGAFKHESVIPTLNQLLQLVGAVLDKFESWVAARND